ncbi:MAG: hemolysin III family protein [Lachnospiraceae bacterium]|nr:hemolysin III family protein [Lachnospiraceae bacterium]
MMTRTKLCDRILPDYTKGEELFNTISHTAGAAFGIAALLTCLFVAVTTGDGWSIASAAIYGASLILLYSMSSLYHGLRHEMIKKVFQVIDHCTIYLLIAGTYTPVMLCAVRIVSPLWAWIIMGIVWGCAIIATVFTAIDLKRYAVFSMICYLGMGWSVVLAIKPTMEALPLPALLWILFGGISYTLGAVLYGLGKKYRYMHSIFHMFVLIGSILQYIGIILYVL